jgi:hypothetical protein
LRETAPFVTHSFPIDELGAAWATIIEKHALKTVVRFG